MACDGFLPEQYGLYSLGTLEQSEASEISAHLQQNCETCVREVRQSISFWTLYAEAATPLVAAPEKRDWNIILGRGNNRKLTTRSKPWTQWGAMAAAVLLASGLSVSVAVLRFQSQRKAIGSELTRTQQQLTDVARQRDQAVAALALHQAPSQTTSVPPTSSVPAHPVGATNQREAQLRQLLSDNQQQLSATRQSLQTSQAQLTETQALLSRQNQELTSLRSNTAELQSRLNEVQAGQNEAIIRVQNLQSRVRELESDRQRLQEAVASQQRGAVQSSLAVSYLELPGTRLIQLSPTESAASARGYVLLTRDNQLLFSEAGLPALPAGRTYQLWLLRTRGEPVVSGGLFTGAGGTQNQIASNNRNLIEGLNAVAVTDEPAGGSRLPTGRKVLIGTLRS